MSLKTLSILLSNHVSPMPDDFKEKGGTNPAFSYCSTDTPLTNSFKTYLDT